MHHVNFKRGVLAVDAMLRRRVDVELSESELRAGEPGGALNDDLDGGVQVLELDGLRRDIEDWLLSCERDRAICSVR